MYLHQNLAIKDIIPKPDQGTTIRLRFAALFNRVRERHYAYSSQLNVKCSISLLSDD